MESLLDFLRSDRFKKRINEVEDRKQKHFIKKFLKLNPSSRQSAQGACASSLFQPGDITVSDPLVSDANRT